MSDSPPEPKSADQLRREAVEILHRRNRGLPSYRGKAAPAPVATKGAAAVKALAEGHEFLRAGRIAEALVRADTALGLSPFGSELLAESWVLHGEVRVRQGNIQAARGAFRKALKINPAHIAARLGLAGAFRQMRQPQQAIPLYLEAIALVEQEEERARLRLLLAESYREAGQSQMARRVFRMAGEGQPPQERLRAFLALLVPATPTEALFLFLGGVFILLVAMLYRPLDALLAFLVLIIVYAAFQWWRAAH